MKKLLIFIILFCQPTFTAIAADTPRVVVSIKPLHSLVSGVMAGVGTPELVVQKGSPHGYSLRPSEAKALARADLIIWVGHELEGFLAKPLQNLAKDAQQLELADLLKTKLLTKRQSGNWEKPAHHHGTEEEGHEAHSEHQQAPDLHLWLDPHLAGEIVIETAEALVRIDPDHAREYRDNKLKMLARLAELDVELKDQLAPVKHYPYLVFHAAYQYFERAYNLNAIGSVTIDPDRKPGAKRISDIRLKLQQLNARCVFSEPQFESRLVATIIEGTGVRTGVLDPLGSDIPAGQDAYFTLMRSLANNLVKGLQ